MTSIEWCDETWNPVVGCSRVSAGCEHCYAEGVAHRGMSPHHRGLTVLAPHGKGPRWTGEVRFVEEALAKPLGWRKPRRVFVNSMSDLFHEGVTNEQIAAVFGIMAACPQHTFQVLTKRPERACAWFEAMGDCRGFMHGPIGKVWEKFEALDAALAALAWNGIAARDLILNGAPQTIGDACSIVSWPLPNVWLGVSVEDQRTADERIPVLLDTPAAVRWVSQEPQIGPVTYRHSWLSGACTSCGMPYQPGDYRWDDESTDHYRPGGQEHCGARGPRLDWIVVGGESGPGARPFDLAWARSTIAQCRAASVRCFVKQLGAWPIFSALFADAPRQGHERLRDRKGGDWSEWPEDVRVREWPEVRRG